MSETHTVMPKSLAMELMKAGMKHFDAGGVTGNTTIGAPDAGAGKDSFLSVASPGQSIPALANPTQSANNAFGLAGNQIQTFGSDFTTQNGYQAGLAPTTQSNYQPGMDLGLNAVQAGMGSQGSIQAQQQGLANQLLAQSQGQGPNPAQAQLAQNTANNVATQGALMASQRGASANAGLMARQAAQQGAATQQAAVGQSATLQAQQQLAAQNALMNQQATMGSQNIAQEGVGANLYGQSGNLQNAQNSGLVQNYGMAQGINAKTAGENADAVNKTTGGLMNGAGGILSALLSKGGEVPSHLSEIARIYHGDFMKEAKNFKDGGGVPGKAQIQGDSPKNDTVPALLSPGEEVLPRSVTQAPDAPEKAKEFVQHLMKIKGKKKGYEAVAKAKGRKAV